MQIVSAQKLRGGGVAIVVEGERFPTVTPEPVIDVTSGEAITSIAWRHLERWVEAGGVIEAAPPPAREEYEAAVSAYLDSEARKLGYDSAASLASYATSSIEEWASEAQAFVALRDRVWRAALDALAGENVETDIEAFVAALPQL